jgi:hypothetical protein
MSLSQARNRRRVGNTPAIGVTASLKEDPESIAQDSPGRFVRADLDYVESVSDLRKDERSEEAPEQWPGHGGHGRVREEDLGYKEQQ